MLLMRYMICTFFFSPILWAVFSLSWPCPVGAKTFNFDQVQFVYFIFRVYALGVIWFCFVWFSNGDVFFCLLSVTRTGLSSEEHHVWRWEVQNLTREHEPSSSLKSRQSMALIELTDKERQVIDRIAQTNVNWPLGSVLWSNPLLWELMTRRSVLSWRKASRKPSWKRCCLNRDLLEGIRLSEGRAWEWTFLEKGTASSKAPRQERNDIFLLVDFIVRKSTFHARIWGNPPDALPQN